MVAVACVLLLVVVLVAGLCFLYLWKKKEKLGNGNMAMGKPQLSNQVNMTTTQTLPRIQVEQSDQDLEEYGGEG